MKLLEWQEPKRDHPEKFNILSGFNIAILVKPINLITGELAFIYKRENEWIDSGDGKGLKRQWGHKYYYQIGCKAYYCPYDFTYPFHYPRPVDTPGFNNRENQFNTAGDACDWFDNWFLTDAYKEKTALVRGNRYETELRDGA